MVQNTAARILCQAPDVNITQVDLLKDIQWLPVLNRVYKIAILPVTKPPNYDSLRILHLYSRHIQSRTCSGVIYVCCSSVLMLRPTHRLEQSSLIFSGYVY